MSYFKKFCDLIGGVGAFFATIFLLGRYMEYNPADIENKLKIFFSSENAKEYRQYVVFIALIVLALIVDRIFARLPLVALGVSALPLCQVMGMFWGNRIYSNEIFYIFVSFTLVAGSIYEVYAYDKNRGKKHLEISSAIVGGMGMLASVASAIFSKKAIDFSARFLESELTEKESLLEERLLLVGIKLIGNVPEEEFRTLVILAVMLAVSVALSFALRKLPVLTAATSAVPLVYALVSLHAEKLVTSPMLVLVLTTVYFFCCVTVAAKERIKKEKT